MDENMITTRKSLGLTGDNERLTIVEGVLHLIYRKTLLLLVPEDNNRHWIVPHNLRELCNFIYFLQGMDDVAFKKNGNEYQLCTDDDFDPGNDSREEANKRLETLESNLRRLMQYIVSDLLDYSTSNMSDDTRGMAEVLVKLIRDLPDWTLITMNKKIVREILRYASQDNSVYKEFYSGKHLKTLLKAARRNFIVSLGDVQYVLGVLSSRSNDYTIKKLTEYVRVIWSIKMTMEFYCVGVRYYKDDTIKDIYENKENKENKIKYITTRFRDTVGGMMLNPDINSHFLKIKPNITGITVNKNWISFNIEKDNNCAYSDIKILTVDKKTYYPLGCITVFCTKEQLYEKSSNMWIDTAIEGECKWRVLSDGQYYRENQSLNGVKTIYLNYFSLFTNLLSPKYVGFYPSEGNVHEEESETTQTLKDNLYEWQESHIMAFPFYSMDWMNRFYIELKKNCSENDEKDNIIEAIDSFNKKIAETIEKVEDVTQKYVERVSEQKLIGNDFKTRFKAIVYAKNSNDSKKSDILNKLTSSLACIGNIQPSSKTPQEKINAYITKLEETQKQANSIQELISKISFTEENEYYDEGLQEQIKTDIDKININDIKNEVGNLTNRMREGVKQSRAFIKNCEFDTTDINLNNEPEENKINIHSTVSEKVNKKIKDLGQKVSNDYTKWMVNATIEFFKTQNDYDQEKSTQEILKDKCNELLKTMSATITL